MSSSKMTGEVVNKGGNNENRWTVTFEEKEGCVNVSIYNGLASHLKGEKNERESERRMRSECGLTSCIFLVIRSCVSRSPSRGDEETGAIAEVSGHGQDKRMRRA